MKCHITQTFFNRLSYSKTLIDVSVFHPEIESLHFIMEPPDAKRPRIQDDGIGYFGEIFTLQFVAFDPQTKKLNPIGDIINPPFVHQIFGDNPTTDGYEDVKIHLNVDELTFFSFLEITNAKTQETVEELRQKFKEFFEYEFCSTLEEFQETLQTTKPLVEAHLSQSIVARTPFRDGELILTLNQLASLHTIVKVSCGRLLLLDGTVHLGFALSC